MPDGEIEYWIHRRNTSRAGTRVVGEVLAVTFFVGLLLGSLMLATSGHVARAILTLGVAPIAALAWFRASRVRWRRGRALVDHGRWALEDSERHTRVEVRAPGWGWSFPHDDQCLLAVQSGGVTLIVAGMDATRVRETLETLGIDPTRRRVGGPIERSPHAPLTLAIMIAVCAIVLLFDPFTSAPLALGAVLVGVLMGRVLDDALFGGRRVEIGQDGIVVTQFTRRRFVPFDEITGARASDGIVEVSERDGTAIRIHCAPQARRQAWHGRGAAGALLTSAAQGQASALAGWITQGVERARALGAEDPDTVRAFQRGDRSFEAWRRALVGAGPYRQGELSLESAQRVFDNPSAPPGARIGAAWVLMAAGGSDARARIVAAAEASVQLDLAAALRAVASGDSTSAEALVEKLLRAVERSG